MRSFFAESTFVSEGGETLQLVCDFYALDVIEGITGEDWDDIVPQLGGGSRALRAKVLYGLLRKRQPEITLDQAAALLFDNQVNALGALMGNVIATASNLNFGEEQTEAETAAKKKPAGRSRVSEKSG